MMVTQYGSATCVRDMCSQDGSALPRAKAGAAGSNLEHWAARVCLVRAASSL